MSVGGLVGAVVGGVVGFFIGGPMGALYGASIGFSLGMAVDPMTPDIPSPGAPDPGTQIMSSTIGDPVPDLTGTGKIAGHLLCYGKERTEPVYSTSSAGGGKGGGPPEPQPQVTGYKYYMSWAVGVMAGPVNTLYAIYRNDDVVWEGELNCPASGGKETLVLEGMGLVDFYFGTADQAVNSKVAGIIPDATLNTPYRNMCWAFFDDCFIGDYNRTPTMKFIVKKIPEYSFSTKQEIQTYDCNPAHVVWFIMHNLTGLPESWLHSDDFAAIASILSTECRGMSVLFERQDNALNYLENINNHIDGIIRYGADGKFHPKLIRNDYIADDLLVVDESTMLDDPVFNRKSWIDTINEVKVQYSELIDVERVSFLFSLWAAGNNDYGQLGLGDVIDRNIFTQVGEPVWKQVSGGMYHSLAIEMDNTLWATGLNNYGQLGLGDNIKREVFTPVGTDTWIQVSCGGYHTFAIKSDGTLWAAGKNGTGQLGLGDSVDRDVFTQVGTYTWKQVSCGWEHTLAIRSDDTLWATGNGGYGQLGLGNWDDVDVFTEVESFFSWKQVSCGNWHTMAISHLNNIYAAGDNGYGQLGLGDWDPRNTFVMVGIYTWKQVSCGDWHSLAITKEKGYLYGTGWNQQGQLGLGSTMYALAFTLIDIYLHTWEQISCGDNHSLAIKSDQTLWATGSNIWGQLGLGDNTKRDVFTQVGADKYNQINCGYYHSLVTKE